MRDLIDIPEQPWSTALKAGIAYFALVFSLGFLLGAFRVAVVSPMIGELPAVIVELPVIVAASWFASRFLTDRCGVARRLAPRLVMGGSAFALLMMGEAGVSMLAFGRSIAQHLASLATVPSIVGLIGQMVFAILPAMQLATRS